MILEYRGILVKCVLKSTLILIDEIIIYCAKRAISKENKALALYLYVLVVRRKQYADSHRNVCFFFPRAQLS